MENIHKVKTMYAHFRPNEFLTLRFGAKELLIGYNILKALQAEAPSCDLDKMIKAMEDKLFPKPKLILVSNYHLCSTCCQEIDVRVDRYQLNTDSNGFINWKHIKCPVLKPDSEREV